MAFKESSPKDCDQLGLGSTFKQQHVSLWQKTFKWNYDAWICYLFLPMEDTGWSVGFLSVTLDSNNFTSKESFQEACQLWKALKGGSGKAMCPMNLTLTCQYGRWRVCVCMADSAWLQSPGLSSLSDSLLLCPQGPAAQTGDVSTSHHSLGGLVSPPPSSSGIDSWSENSAASYQDRDICGMTLVGEAGKERSRAQWQKTLWFPKETWDSSQRWSSTRHKALSAR